MSYSCEKYSAGLIILGGYVQPSILSNLSPMKLDSFIAKYKSSGWIYMFSSYASNALHCILVFSVSQGFMAVPSPKKWHWISYAEPNNSQRPN
jgi:hypothetical protein